MSIVCARWSDQLFIGTLPNWTTALLLEEYFFFLEFWQRLFFPSLQENSPRHGNPTIRLRQALAGDQIFFSRQLELELVILNSCFLGAAGCNEPLPTTLTRYHNFAHIFVTLPFLCSSIPERSLYAHDKWKTPTCAYVISNNNYASHPSVLPVNSLALKAVSLRLAANCHLKKYP